MGSLVPGWDSERPGSAPKGKLMLWTEKSEHRCVYGLQRIRLEFACATKLFQKKFIVTNGLGGLNDAYPRQFSEPMHSATLFTNSNLNTT